MIRGRREHPKNWAPAPNRLSTRDFFTREQLCRRHRQFWESFWLALALLAHGASSRPHTDLLWLGLKGDRLLVRRC